MLQPRLKHLAGALQSPTILEFFTCSDTPRLAFLDPVDLDQARSSDQDLDGHRAWRLADDAFGVRPREDLCKVQFHIRLWDWGTVVAGGETFEGSLGAAHHECADFGGIHTTGECVAGHQVVGWEDIEASLRFDLRQAGLVADHWQTILDNTWASDAWRGLPNDGIAPSLSFGPLAGQLSR